MEVDPSASPMFPTPVRFLQPADLSFRASYRNRQTFARYGSATSRLLANRKQSQMSAGTDDSNLEDDIIDVELSSGGVSDSGGTHTHG
jgi:hypothetical protein